MSVTIHTSHGDIKLEVFCDLVPRSAENFLALCASDYYLGNLFHRNMKGFMIQGGGDLYLHIIKLFLHFTTIFLFI